MLLAHCWWVFIGLVALSFRSKNFLNFVTKHFHLYLIFFSRFTIARFNMLKIFKKVLDFWMN